jgi:SAM-dependent methyltransferase
MDLKEVDILGAGIGDHWYYRSKAAAMTRLVGEPTPSRILDVGAGSGYFSRYLLQHTAAKHAWCVDISYETESDSLEGEKPIHFRRSIRAVDADIVLLMDVLEHVDDDVGLLSDYVDKVPTGARFLVSVPAFRSLWSEHDIFLEHKRRYTLPEVEELVMRAGLTVDFSAYYFGLVFPIAVATRFFSRFQAGGTAHSQLKRHNPIVNETLAAICKAELPIFTMNRLAGLTVFSLARKS